MSAIRACFMRPRPRATLLLPHDQPPRFPAMTASDNSTKTTTTAATTATVTTEEDPFAALPTQISSALKARGFTDLTAVQKAVVAAESQGRDLRISSQTGSGKTVAIGIALATHFLDAQKSEQGGESSTDDKKASKKSGPPRKSRGSVARPTALVIVPTRELAAQVQNELQWLYANLRGLSVQVVTGGTSIVMERRALARGAGLIVGTPGRLLDHMRNRAINCDSIAHVILDEADQMLDMGFREELDGILEQLPKSRSSHLMSATFPRAVVSLADRYQKNVLTLEGTRLGVANADIQHIAYAIRRHETYPALVNTLLLAGDSRCLLFVNRRIDATELAEKLASDGFGAAPFSGELAQTQRTRTLAAFKNGTFNILVSTDVAARGIDVPNISTVIHVDPPRNSEAYIHRSGRTGRAGRSGRSVLLVAGPDSRRAARMLQAARIEVSWQPVPQPEKVQKALLKQARREMHARLAEDAPTEAQLMYAKQLIEERDATHVIATLLEMAKTKPPREPMTVVGLDPFAEDRSKRRGGRSESRRDGYSTAKVGAGGGRNGSPRKGTPKGAPRDASGFTRFVVTWGEQKGATPSRILSHICRRGGIESSQVGAIQILAKSSTVDIARDAADAFETSARRPDKRDPGIMVRRDQGGSSPSSQSSPPKGPARDAHRPNAKRPVRPTHLKKKAPRKNKGPRHSASR
jgi:ATP-dependent RNA helicase DeaD